jgi:serine/threonine protein kinase
MMSGDMNMSATISNYTFNNNSTYCTLGKSVDYSVSIDSFHLIKVIGRGSFGKVYLVQKKSSGKYYAMKTLKKQMIIRRE